MDREEEIRLIAYNFWQEENYPDGRDYEHWLRAELIWEGQQKPQTSNAKKKIQTGKNRRKTKKGTK